MTSELQDLSIEQLVEDAAAVAIDDASRESEPRWAVVQEMARRRDAVIWQAARDWCSHPKPLMRCLGADLLGQLGDDDAASDLAQDAAETLSLLMNDSDPGVLSSALVALGNLGSSVDWQILNELSAHDAAEVRESVAFYFEVDHAENPLAIQTLIQLTSDPEPEVRNRATFGLGSLPPGRAPAILQALALRLTDSYQEIREEAMMGLAAQGDARAVPAIYDELQLQSVANLAIEAALALPDKRFLPALLKLSAANPETPQIELAIERCRGAGFAPWSELGEDPRYTEER